MTKYLVTTPVDEMATTPSSWLFSTVAKKHWSVFLDSCEHPQSRFDIMSHSPVAVFRFRNGQSSLEIFSDNFQWPEIRVDACPFETLRQLQQSFTEQIDAAATEIPKDIPFVLGCLGAFGYDVNTFTDAIENPKPDEYQLDDIAVGFYDNALIKDNQNDVVYHCFLSDAPATSSNSGDWAVYSDWLAEFNTTEMSAPAELNYRVNGDWQPNMNKASYVNAINRIHGYLRDGDCYQVNYAQRFDIGYSGDEWAIYIALREANSAPFSAFIRTDTSCILSVSPERFLSIKDRKVETKPIKGTRKRAKDAEDDKALADDLLNSEKDRAENLMIVDLLRNDISKHCAPHSVKVPKLFALESYPAVHHMVSTVIGQLRPSSSPFDLLKGAFPGGSITGAPKVRAMQVIRELEPNKRSIYCGSIGYIGLRDDMDTSICIRTVLAENQKLYCWAGGGIVLDSDAEDEYDETLHKVAKILPIVSNT